MIGFMWMINAQILSPQFESLLPVYLTYWPRKCATRW